MQAQTVECVVIAEAVMAKDDGTNIIIVLNKVSKLRHLPHSRGGFTTLLDTLSYSHVH